ncbi:MAG: hypothetical protein ACLFU5_01935 [Thermoplasmata archaeon]
MKINIIYDSKYGNGKTISEDLMEMVKENGLEAHIYSLKSTNPEKIGYADFFVFSSPTRFGGPSRRMKKMIKKGSLPENGEYGLITTSKKDGEKTAIEMSKMLEERGMHKKVDDLNLKVKGKKGPLEKGYRDKIKRFYGDIANVTA